MPSDTKLPNDSTLIKFALALSLILFFSGCTVPLSTRTCSSVQGVSLKTINDRQAGLSKRDAIDKLTLFTSGKPDSKHFFEVASQIIEAAYMEPSGKSEAERAEIAKSFVSRMHHKCLSGDLGPSYNPATRVAPAIN
jgi:hypothetical protein